MGDDNYDEEDDDYAYEESSSSDYSDADDEVAAASAFRVVDFSAVEGTMKRITQSVSTVLDVDFDRAQVLLKHNRWDDEKLIERFFADSDKVCAESGLAAPAELEQEQQKKKKKKKKSFLCRICYDTDVDAGFSLGCGHTFCTGCYRGFLRNQVAEGPACVVARCPEYKCARAVPASVFAALLGAEDCVAAYSRYAVRQFVEASKTHRYCPAPGCEMVSEGNARTPAVVCSCGHQYCFQCTQEDHRPCSCDTLAKWICKCNDDSETVKWMAVNTKSCPKCVSRIEKNHGCNHMTCRQCKHEFCWICMADWAGHSACNRFTAAAAAADGEDAAAADAAAAAAAAEKAELANSLERYIHYFTRYQNHDAALKIAEKRRDALAAAAAQGDDDAQAEAVAQVIQCRRVLKYTYVLGFFMDKNAPQKLLFERHQEMLEGNTDRLQELLEMKDLPDRTTLVNHTRVIEKFRSSLLEDINPLQAAAPSSA